jgi:hypothetical protein
MGGITSPERRPILLGCVGALIMSMLSCCALSGLAVSPAFGGSVPSPPAADPTQPDITMKIREQFINRALIEALPDAVPVKGELDVQPGNRLVFNGEFTILVVKVPVEMTLLLTFEGGQLRIEVESIEAAGYDLGETIGLDASSLTDALSGPMQEQIEAGLGPGAQIMDITTDDEHIIISARWAG